ncbi:MAG: Potassium channel protein [Thermoleophilia bacterium]|nr:Potassium channel protein [Thermoleophilia bacterium]
MSRPVDIIRMPSEFRVNPFGQLGKRLVLGLVMLLITAVGTYVERDGYNDTADGKVDLLDAIYYSTVSITTTGYGDVVPVSDAARLFTTIIVTPARMVFLVLLVGTSVELITLASRTILRENRWRKNVHDHVVICGFGVKGRAAFESLREQGTPGEQMVVIDPGIEEIAAAARLGCVGIHGDASSNEHLEAARVDRARVVIVTPHRDDAAVLITLSVRQLNPSVHIVAAARELENAPLLRRSGADVVLTTSGATGRMMGMAAVAPHYVQVVEELLETGSGLDLVERRVTQEDAGPLTSHRRPGELVLAVFRDDQLVARNPDGEFQLLAGDGVVSVSAPPVEAKA